jgi:hypothetical protein
MPVSIARKLQALRDLLFPDIALMIGIDPKTLRKHYRRELDTGHTTHARSGRMPSRWMQSRHGVR